MSIRFLCLTGVVFLASSFGLLACSGSGESGDDSGVVDGDGANSDGESQDGDAGGLADDGVGGDDFNNDGGDDPGDGGQGQVDGDGAQADAEDGSTTDAGDQEPICALSLSPLDSWQRGPVRLEFGIRGEAGQTADLTFAYSLDSQNYEPTTSLMGFQDAARNLVLTDGEASGTYVWDSKLNLSVDESEVYVRASLRIDQVQCATALVGPFDLHNATDFDRAVVVTHKWSDGPAPPPPGYSSSLVWLRSTGALEDSGLDLDCGEGPSLATFTADGRFGVVLGSGAGGNQYSLAPFQVDRQGALSPLGGVLQIPDLFPADLVAAPDGSGIWLVDRNGQGGLGFLSFAGDQPELLLGDGGDSHVLPMTLSSAMAILPDNRRAVLSGGALIIDDPPYDFTLVDLEDLTILSQAVVGLEYLSDKIAITPDGSKIVMPGYDLMVVDLVGDQVSSVQSVSISGPFWVRVHAQGTSAIVTSWEGDRVTAVSLDSNPPAVTQELTVPLAAEVDCVVEGTLTGWCLVSSVSNLLAIRLTADGQLSSEQTLGFGTGSSSNVWGSAVQP